MHEKVFVPFGVCPWLHYQEMEYLKRTINSSPALSLTLPPGWANSIFQTQRFDMWESKRQAKNKRPGATVIPCLLLTSFFINSQYCGPKWTPPSGIITRLLWEQTLSLLVLFFLISPLLKPLCIVMLLFLPALSKDSSGEVRRQNVFILKGQK